jgi:hypothetical protein
MKTTPLAFAAVALLLGSQAFAGANDVETFFGWSKDGTWFAWQKVSGPNDLTELYFCATDDAVPPTWPATLNDSERSKVERQSCVTYTDPNRAPFGWKTQLSLPKPSFTKDKTTRVLSELATDGENPGYVVEEKDPKEKDKEKKTVCYVSGLRESSKLQHVWWHPSGRWVAAQVDGHITHCDRPLKPADPAKAEKKKGGKK